MGLRTMIDHLPPPIVHSLRRAHRAVVPVRWYLARLVSFLLQSISDRRRRARAIRLVRLVWGNPGYSASAELCEVVDVTVAPTSSVVELGSGLTTLLLRRRVGPRGSVLTIEHDRAWARALNAALPPGPRASLSVAALAEVSPGVHWYGISPEVLKEADVIICDGPPSHDTPGARRGLLWALQATTREVTVIIDDVDRPEEQAMLDELLSMFGATMTTRVTSAAGDVAVVDVPAREGSVR